MLQDEYAEVTFRETIGQSAAPEPGADHYRIVSLIVRVATDNVLSPQVVTKHARHMI